MNVNDYLNNFDYEAFMVMEFPKTNDTFPSIDRSLKHFDRITRLMMECASQSLKGAEDNENESAIHANTRYTIVCNFRMRTINLIKIFTELLDLKGGLLFDEATANIVARSLLESYLVYYRLYNGCGGDKETQELYFNLYDLSGTLHFVKHGKWLQTIGPVKFDEKEYKARIKNLINAIKHSSKFQSLTTSIQDSVKKVESGKQDYLSFINFNRLIRESPLPTEFITSYYSYSSSFAHSEGFSSTISQVYFESREHWKGLNEMQKFKLIYVCLAVSSQFFRSYIEYDKTELDDDMLQDICEITSLSNYYLTAVNLNK